MQEWGSIPNIFPRLVNENRDGLKRDRSDNTSVCPDAAFIQVGMNVIAHAIARFRFQKRPLFRTPIVAGQTFVGFLRRHTVPNDMKKQRSLLAGVATLQGREFLRPFFFFKKKKNRIQSSRTLRLVFQIC